MQYLACPVKPVSRCLFNKAIMCNAGSDQMQTPTGVQRLILAILQTCCHDGNIFIVSGQNKRPLRSKEIQET